MSNNFVDRLVMCCWTAISNRLFQMHNKYRFNYNPIKWNQETINIDIITEEKFPRTCVLQKMCFAFKNTKIQDLLYFKKCLYATTHFFIVWIYFSIFNMNTANKKQQSSVPLKTGIFEKGGPARRDIEYRYTCERQTSRKLIWTSLGAKTWYERRVDRPNFPT